MPGKQMLCCILISIISEGDMKIFISLFLFIISTNSFADDITHAGVVRIEGLITEKKPALFLMSQKILQLICQTYPVVR